MLTLNGAKLSRFSCSPELRGTAGKDLTHIGVIAHELAHSLFGLPDFYDTDYEKGGTAIDLAEWDLMASGSWNDDGRTPPYFSAYGRVACGWVPCITLNDSTANITILNPESDPNPTIYRINTKTFNEYFLLENRQQVGWDKYIPSSGLLIYLVDKNHSGWNFGTVNANPARRGYYVKQAGCGVGSNCTIRTTDPFPQFEKYAFTDDAIPNSKSRNGAKTKVPITKIAHNTTLRSVSFKVNGGVAESGTPVYGIAHEQTDPLEIPEADYGYNVSVRKNLTCNVRISNSGNRPTGTLQFSLEGTHPEAFDLPVSSLSNLYTQGELMLPVRPQNGLDAGTYQATVVIAGEHNLSASFEVTFTVVKASGAIVTAPKTAKKTTTEIAVYASKLRNSTDQTIEYAIDNIEQSDLSLLTWQNDTVFSNLLHNSSFYVYARSVENRNYKAGTPVKSAKIQTDLDTPNQEQQADSEPSLQAWITEGVLHIKGLNIGAEYRLYSLSGILVGRNKATSDIETFNVGSLTNGLFILVSEGKTLKINN